MRINRRCFWLHPETIAALSKFGQYYETQDKVITRLLHEHGQQQKYIKVLERDLSLCKKNKHLGDETPNMLRCQYCGQAIIGFRALRIHEKDCPRRFNLEDQQVKGRLEK